MDDNEIIWGKPTLEELREHYTTPSSRVDLRSVLVQPESGSSIDLDDSFKAILQERRRKAESVINYSPVSANKELSLKTLGNRLMFEKTQSMETDQSWMNCGDDTFLDMEKMCENTLESAAVERLLNEFDTDECKSELLEGLNNMTQLNDIEAPSLMWDQTIVAPNPLKPSPLKLVYTNRPSTIIEESIFSNSSKEENKIKIVEDKTILSNESTDLESTDSYSNNHISLNTSNNDSFKTAKPLDVTANQSSYETANDQTSTTIRNKQSDVNVFPLMKKRNFYDSSYAQSLSISTSNSNVSNDSLLNVKYEKNSAFLDSLDIIEVSSKENTGEIIDDDDGILLQEDSLLQDDDNTDNILEAPDFNDTLEEMDFIMKHGMKFMEQQKNHSQIIAKKVLKQQNSNAKLNAFPIEKPTPDTMNSKNTPNTFKKPQVISRLPVFKSNSKKYDHIISPIHTYIKESPQYPLMAKQKGTTGLIDQLHDPNRRDTVFSQNNENLFTEDPSYKPVIPLKGVIATQKSQTYDARTPIKMPGGEKVQKLIGNHTPSVIKHEGRFKSYTNVPINANDTVDESFANLSIASGDVSIQVMKNVHRA